MIHLVQITNIIVKIIWKKRVLLIKNQSEFVIMTHLCLNVINQLLKWIVKYKLLKKLKVIMNDIMDGKEVLILPALIKLKL